MVALAPPLVGLGALAVTIAAFALLMVLYGGRNLFGNFLVGMARQIPFVGGYVAGAIDAVIGTAISLTEGVMAASSGVLIDLLSASAQVIWSTVSMITGSIETIAQLIDNLWLQTIVLGAQIAVALAQIANEVAARAAAVTGLSALLALARADIAWIVNAIIPAAIAQLRAELQAWASAAIAVATAPIAAAVAYAQARISAVESTLTAEAHAIEAELSNEVWPAIDNLTNIDAWVVPALTTLVSANLITRLATLEADWATTLEDCIIPSCSSVRPYRDMLNLLQQTATLAAIAIVVEQAVTRPNETAHAVSDAADALESIGRAIASPFVGGVA